MGSSSGTKEYHTLKLLNQKLSALETTKYQHKIGAIILSKKGNVLSVGFNSYVKTHPRQYHYNRKINPTRVFLHAEIDALVKCRDKPHTMIISRMGKDGKTRLSRPCKGCFNAIKDVGVQKVFFTNDFGELVLLDLDVELDDYCDYHEHLYNKAKEI